MMEEYLSELKEKDFIEELSSVSGKTYRVTDKGLTYLDKYKMVSEFTSSFGLS
jgi:predicted transcriptional regulator